MKKVLVYGVGCFFENHEEQLKEEYDIVGYVDRSGSLRGQEIPVQVSDFEVTVEFDRAGVKKMFASFAKLQKI